MSWYESLNINSMIFSWLSSMLFWLFVIVILVVAIYGSLWLKKRRKLKFPVIEQTLLGNGKIGLIWHKGGWFKSKSMLFGLWDYGGEDVFKIKDGRLILEASSEDYHDINGKRGLIVIRKGDDPKILIPLSKFEVDKASRNEIMSIAPADFRDASSKICSSAENETMGKFEKYLPWISLMVVGIIILVCIILIVQMIKSSQAEASKLILDAGKLAIQNVQQSLPSVAP